MKPIPKSYIVKIRILSTVGCLNTPPTISRIEEASKELNTPIDIERVIITTQDQANAYRFMGSPTVQINGVDIDPEMRDNQAYGFM